MHAVEKYRAEFVAYMETNVKVKDPVNLYEPITYILGLGGKRLRPVLTLMASDIFGSDYKNAMQAALAIEVFHNFSLVHDDIMDDAPLRRGHPSVHEKWDINTGILSGDAMLIHAYQLLESYEGDMFRNLSQLFSTTAKEVCEGQQYDIDFETQDHVTLAAYLKMINYKTAVLVGAALKMGAIIAGAPLKDQNGIYEFGRNLGIAFQLKDDYLDAFGNPKTFGKRVGGDIVENKKTYLYIKSLELGSKDQVQELLRLFSIKTGETSSKIDAVRKLYTETGANASTLEAINSYTQSAFERLDELQLTSANKKQLIDLGNGLLIREV